MKRALAVTFFVIYSVCSFAALWCVVRSSDAKSVLLWLGIQQAFFAGARHEMREWHKCDY